jgi:hypothetical protein
MAVGSSDLIYATPFTSMQQGALAGQKIQQNALSLQDQQQSASDQGALRNALSQGMSGTPQAQSQAAQQLSQSAPGQMPAYTSAIQSMNGAQRAQMQQRSGQIMQTLSSIANIPAGPQREQAYQTSLDQEQAQGNDVSQLRNLPSDQGMRLAYAHAQTIDQTLKSMTPESYNVAPGNARYTTNPLNGTMSVQEQPLQAKMVEVQTGTDPHGNPIIGKFYDNGPGKPLTPLTAPGGYGGGQQAMNTAPDGSGNTNQNPQMLAFANQQLAQGATPQQAMQAATQQFQPSGGFAMGLSPDGKSFVDQGAQGSQPPPPKNISSTVQPVSGLSGQGMPAQQAHSVMPQDQALPFGSSVKQEAASNQSTVAKRVSDLSDMQRQGVPVNDAQRQTYLTTGKFAGDADAPLSPGEETEAQSLANYKLPVTAYQLSKPTMQPLIQRALQINPAFNAMQYGANQKTVNDFASSSQGSSGGTVTAAITALGHLDDLADISKQLPNTTFANGIPGGNFIDNAVNASSNALSSGSQSQQLKAWNSGKNLLAGELAKMVKGGVASEAEQREILDNLNPNDPNRDTALATAGKFMLDKVQGMEDKRDSVLGPASPGTSLLPARSQKQAVRVIGLNPNFNVPQFNAPGSLSVPNYGATAQASAGAPAQQQQASAQPRAVNPQTGHAVVWNGSAWVSE